MLSGSTCASNQQLACCNAPTVRILYFTGPNTAPPIYTNTSPSRASSPSDPSAPTSSSPSTHKSTPQNQKPAPPASCNAQIQLSQADGEASCDRAPSKANPLPTSPRSDPAHTAISTFLFSCHDPFFDSGSGPSGGCLYMRMLRKWRGKASMVWPIDLTDGRVV